MIDPFEEINFLTRSENRGRLLETLTEGAHTEHELVDRTGISRVTVNRALDAFRERGWAQRVGEEYTTTKVGEMLAVDCVRFRETADLACRLGPVIDLLPLEGWISISRRWRRRRSLIRRTTTYSRRSIGGLHSFGSPDQLRLFTYRSGRMVAELIREEIVAGTLEMEAILAPSELERLQTDRRTCEAKQGLLEAGATYYMAGEEPPKPYSIGMLDDIAAVSG
ncbi:MAG: hypothetical protein ABEJ79_02150 [Halolamina sp.]